jgi:hypothetical protein
MRSIPAGILILAMSCDSNVAGPTRHAALGQSFELRVGETATVEEAGLTIGFTGVTNDSRCPIDVVCIRAGDATLRLTLRRLPQPATLVEVKTPGPPDAVYDGYSIEVLTLLPAPRASTPTDPNAYVATLVVDRASP